MSNQKDDLRFISTSNAISLKQKSTELARIIPDAKFPTLYHIHRPNHPPAQSQPLAARSRFLGRALHTAFDKRVVAFALAGLGALRQP
jgi:hypothetical protein